MPRGSKPGEHRGGRKKGTVNKDTEVARDIAKRLGISPFEINLRFASGDWEGLGYTSATRKINTDDGIIEVDTISPELRQKSAKDCLPFLHPQLKSIEHTGKDGANLFDTLADAFKAANDARHTKDV